jgi:hypothetical protein
MNLDERLIDRGYSPVVADVPKLRAQVNYAPEFGCILFTAVFEFLECVPSRCLKQPIYARSSRDISHYERFSRQRPYRIRYLVRQQIIA